MKFNLMKDEEGEKKESIDDILGSIGKEPPKIDHEKIDWDDPTEEGEMRKAFEKGDLDVALESGEIIDVAERGGKEFMKASGCSLKPLSMEARMTIEGLTYDEVARGDRLEEYEELASLAEAEMAAYREEARKKMEARKHRYHFGNQSYDRAFFLKKAGVDSITEEEYKEKIDRKALLRAKREAFLEGLDSEKIEELKREIERKIITSHGGKINHKGRAVYTSNNIERFEDE